MNEKYESMKDPIERQAAIDAMKSLCNDCDADYCGACRVTYPGERNVIKVLEDLPSAQLERKKGKWVRCDGDRLKTMCKCSECGAMIDINEKNRNFFCYHCGARMYGEEN